MTRPPFWHLAVLALFLSAGCADNRPPSTTSTPPPPFPDKPAAYVFNYSTTFDRDLWAEQALIGGSEVFLIGYPVDPVTGQSASVSPIQLAVANLSTREYVQGPTGTRVGGASDVFAAQGEGTTYVAFDARPPGTTSVMLEGWITWATYRDGKWDMEEAPARWALRDLMGLAFFDGAPRVLLYGPQGYELWTLDGGWTSESLPDLSIAGTAVLAANATALIIAGSDRAAQPTVWERRVGQAGVTAHTLQGPRGIGSGGFYAASATLAAPAVVAWTVSAILPAPGVETLQTYLAVGGADGWEVQVASIPESVGPQVIATSNATFVLTIMPNGDGDQIHWWDGAAWHRCELQEANRQQLLTIGDEAFLAYLHTWGAGVARLTTETTSCLVGLDALPGPPLPGPRLHGSAGWIGVDGMPSMPPGA